MTVIFRERVERRDLQLEPNTLFVFGDNELRVGFGGQAVSCRGEPNAVGVATKRAPSRKSSAYWSDADYDRCVSVVDADLERVFAHVRAGGCVVIPKAGIGTGRSELPTRAPRIMEHIREKIRELIALSRQVTQTAETFNRA